MFTPKRFVIEAYNHFIKDCQAIKDNNEHEHIKKEYQAKIETLEISRNNYIIGMLTEREAIIILKNNF